MMMKVYDAERLAGLEQTVSNSQVLAFDSQLSLTDQIKVNPKLTFATNQNQFDLYYLKGILVSLGWNLNDDVFDAAEVWKAKNTPEDKPLDIEHDHHRIIGHITEVFPVDNDIKIITSDEMPEGDFHLMTSAVIYKYWKNEEQIEEIAKIIEEIEAGEWFLSMECLLAHFDYAVITPEGKTGIIERTEATAHLTKYLRRYGGEGSYNGYKFGRLLRDFVFSGKGLVKKPANKKSVIYAGLQNFKVNHELNLAEVTVEAKQLEEKVAELTKQHEQDAAKLTEAQDKLAKANDAIRTKEAEVAELNKKLEEANAASAKVNDELKKANESLASITAEKVKNERMSMLKEVYNTDAEVEAAYKKFAEATDDLFKGIVESLKANKPAEAADPNADPAGELAAASANLNDQTGKDNVANPAPDAANSKDKQRQQAVAAVSEFFAKKFNVASSKGGK